MIGLKKMDNKTLHYWIGSKYTFVRGKDWREGIDNAIKETGYEIV